MSATKTDEPFVLLTGEEMDRADAATNPLWRRLVAELRQARHLNEELADAAGDCSHGVHGSWCRRWRAMETENDSLRAQLEAANASVADYQKHLGEIVAFGADAATLYDQLGGEIRLREAAEVALAAAEAELSAVEEQRDNWRSSCALVEREREELRAQLEEARAENCCDVCVGTGSSESGPCMCGGSGKMSKAAVYLREQLFDARAQLEEATVMIHELARLHCRCEPYDPCPSHALIHSDRASQAEGNKS